MSRLPIITAIIGCSLFSSVSAQIPSYVPDEGLVLFMGFNGDVNDMSGNGNNGSIAGAVTYQADRFGNPESAISLTGNASNHVDVNYTPSFSFSEGFTMAAWFNTNTLSGDRRILQMGNTDSSGQGFHLMKSDDSMGAVLKVGGPYFGQWSDLDGPTSITTDNWHHIALTADFTSNEWKIYIDSELTRVDTSSTSMASVNAIPLNYNATFEIGKKAGSSYNGDAWNGELDDIGFWSRALEPNEITSLFSGEFTFGCTDSTACNFDTEATLNDGTCIPSGCMDANACNYDADAGCDDGSCVFPPLVDLGATATLCEGQSLILDVDAPGLNVLWSTGETESSIAVSESGTYSVQAGEALSADHRLEFDGIDDYISYGASLNITTYPFSVQADITVPDDYFPILNTDDGIDGYSGIWCYASSTNLTINVGEGNGGGSSDRRSMTGSLGLQVGETANITAVVRGATDMSLYVNGADIGGTYSGSGNTNFVDNGLDAVTGRYTPSSGLLENQLQYYEGSIDNLHVWSKALTAEEAVQYATFPATGSESNLVALYTFDEGNGSTTTDVANGHVANLFGNPLWTEETSVCGATDTISVYFVDCLELCGPGTHWDLTSGSCMISSPTDVDLDGCTGVGDILEVLSNFGACLNPEDESDTTEITEWSCGDTLEYWGYGYRTTQIGEQCWLAENLRANTYLDGSPIDNALSDQDWASTTQGAITVYGLDSPECVESVNTTITTCTDGTSLDEYGRLYNWYTVNDTRNLCPEAWHVPSEAEWQDFIDWGAVNLTSGCLSCELKTTTDWSGGNGSNSLGWNGKAGGSRIHLPSSSHGYWDSGYSGFWWTSTESTASGARSRWMGNGNGVFGGVIQKNIGLSVRCLKDE